MSIEYRLGFELQVEYLWRLKWIITGKCNVKEIYTTLIGCPYKQEQIKPCQYCQVLANNAPLTQTKNQATPWETKF